MSDVELRIGNIRECSEPVAARIEGRGDWCRLVLGLFLVFGLFHGSATILGSDRGQSGILIGTLVVAATAAADWSAATSAARRVAPTTWTWTTACKGHDRRGHAPRFSC